MGISIFEKILESLHLSFLLKTGDKKTTNQIAGRDITNIIMIEKPKNVGQDLIAEEAQELITKQRVKVKSHVNIILGNFLGIVKSKEKPGTRVHLEFAVMNNEDSPTVLRGAYIVIGSGIVHFKSFYKSNPDGSRAYDRTKGFPIIINSKGATKLHIEFENIDQELISNDENKGEVVVLVEGDTISRKKFMLKVDTSMIKVLKQSQDSADKTGIPAIFPATIQSTE